MSFFETYWASDSGEKYSKGISAAVLLTFEIVALLGSAGRNKALPVNGEHEDKRNTTKTLLISNDFFVEINLNIPDCMIPPYHSIPVFYGRIIHHFPPIPINYIQIIA